MSGHREDRTPDLGVISTTLYRLSYATIPIIPVRLHLFKSVSKLNKPIKGVASLNKYQLNWPN